MVYVESKDSGVSINENHKVDKSYSIRDTNITIDNLAPYSVYLVTFIVCNEIVS